MFNRSSDLYDVSKGVHLPGTGLVTSQIWLRQRREDVFCGQVWHVKSGLTIYNWIAICSCSSIQKNIFESLLNIGKCCLCRPGEQQHFFYWQSWQRSCLFQQQRSKGRQLRWSISAHYTPTPPKK